MIISAAMRVGRHMHVVENHLPLLDPRKTLVETYAARPNGFHLRARQLDAGLNPLKDMVVA